MIVRRLKHFPFFECTPQRREDDEYYEAKEPSDEAQAIRREILAGAARRDRNTVSSEGLV